jgi:hypothetical protein
MSELSTQNRNQQISLLFNVAVCLLFFYNLHEYHDYKMATYITQQHKYNWKFKNRQTPCSSEVIKLYWQTQDESRNSVWNLQNILNVLRIKIAL